MEFKIIKLKLDKTVSSVHYVYFKAYGGDNVPSKPADRTLFIVGIPPYCPKHCLSAIFSTFGKINSITYQRPANFRTATEDHRSKFFRSDAEIKRFKNAYVVFESAASCKRALNASFDHPFILQAFSDTPISTGYDEWCSEYSNKIVDPVAMESEIETYMKKFDERQAEEKLAEKKKADQPDEEGWITVTKSGRRKGAPRTENASQKLLEKRNKKQKAEVVNFYTFQARESKLKHLEDLRKKFEEDKKRISVLRASKKFRPY